MDIVCRERIIHYRDYTWCKVYWFSNFLEPKRNEQFDFETYWLRAVTFDPIPEMTWDQDL